jgi:hypothetical protein
MFQSEVAYVLAMSPVALKRWRKEGCGPKWRAMSKAPGLNRPLYDRASVLELRAAYEVLARLGLRSALLAPLPEMPRPSVEAA